MNQQKASAVSEEEYVVLVDERNKVLGRGPKLASHHGDTPLHRGFSAFIFNEKHQLLLQQRSHKKKTWPLVWSNSCCGHPKEEETIEDAARRRLSFELGIESVTVSMALPNYRYRCERDGIVENEICPVVVGYTTQEPQPNPDEVEAIKWISWEGWLRETKTHPDSYSQWCVEETLLLEKNSSTLPFVPRKQM